MATETATLGGGCFWCLEAVFQQLAGVSGVTSGYSGGTVAEPTYQAVCSGETGHAEVVQIEFDPEVIAYRDLLDVFFATHDPTTIDSQGADVGSQYRSAIFFHSGQQLSVAHQVIGEIDRSSEWPNPIVTEVIPFDTFYPAEPNHQTYYLRNAQQPYCQMVIDPKLERLRRRFADRLIGEPRD